MSRSTKALPRVAMQPYTTSAPSEKAQGRIIYLQDYFPGFQL